jgi:hypothetical protein
MVKFCGSTTARIADWLPPDELPEEPDELDWS